MTGSGSAAVVPPDRTHRAREALGKGLQALARIHDQLFRDNLPCRVQDTDRVTAVAHTAQRWSHPQMRPGVARRARNTGARLTGVRTSKSDRNTPTHLCSHYEHSAEERTLSANPKNGRFRRSGRALPRPVCPAHRHQRRTHRRGRRSGGDFCLHRHAGQARHECTLAAGEFLRRYLQHVLPPGQHRVRYFGWLHPAAKARRAVVETLLAVVIIVREKPDPPPPWHLRCPHCAQFTRVRIGSLPRGPPTCSR